jgi:hypothetical protein
VIECRQERHTTETEDGERRQQKLKTERERHWRETETEDGETQKQKLKTERDGNRN